MAPSENKSDPLNLNIQRSMVALSVLGSVLVLIWLLKYSAYGIDFTDEGFYLVWISNPFIYSGSITQFGFIYHPLYSLLGGDISAIRQANILITFTLAWCLVNAFLASLIPEIKDGRFTLLVASAGLAISALTLFDSWLPTPNYNSLNLQALLVSATGMVLSEKKPHRKSIIGWILIGVGGWLTFMAKPSTALALALGTLFYLLFSRKFSVRMLFLALATATTLLLVSAFAIDGSVLQFLKRLQLGMEFSKYLGGGHTPAQILRIDNFHLDKRAKTALIITFGAVFIALWSTSTRSKKISIAGLLVSLSLLILTASLTLGQVQRAAGFGQFQGLLVFALVYAAIATGLLLGKFKALESIPAPQWAIAALFMGMPHIYAFGTNRNYWQTGSSAAIFWLLAGVVVLVPLIRERASWLLLLPLTFATQAVTATLLQTGIEQPQRQPQPLRLNKSSLEIGPQHSPLLLSDEYANYIERAVATARTAGFEHGYPIIDLSGQSPGLLYALGAKSIGQPWILGDYPGSLLFAKAGLSHFTCKDIANAWVVFEQDGPRSIPTELMASVGADFPSSYKQVGSWQTAAGAGGYDAIRHQSLYMPKAPSETLTACKILRDNH